MNWLLRIGINRGLIGGNRFFASLGVIAAVYRIAQKLAGTGPRTLYTHELKPGDVLVVTENPKPKKRSKKKS